MTSISSGVCISNEFVSMIESAANGNMQTNKFAYEEDFVSNSGMHMLHLCT